MRRAVTIKLSDSERDHLGKLVKGRRTPVRLVERARIVLLAADGTESQLIAAEVGVARGTVQRWRERYAANRFAGIEKDLPRGGRTPRQLQNHASRIVEATLHEKPPATTHWTIRTLACHLGVSKSLVERTWRIHNLRPHLLKTFKVSNDAQFVEKVIDVVGL